jgi:hypothetical protein
MNFERMLFVCFLKYSCVTYKAATSCTVATLVRTVDSIQIKRRAYPVQLSRSAATRVAKKNMLTGNLKCMFVFSSFSFFGISFSFEPL